MSWLYSQALVEEYSEVNCSDGIQSAQLNVMPTQHKFWRNDKTIEHSKLSQFGLTLQLLTDTYGKALLTWYLADSRARTSAPPEKVQAFREQDQDSGATWRESLARFDPDTRTLKTVQLSLLEDSTSSSPTLPRWGTMLGGACFQLPTWARRTKETGCGYSVPTPVANPEAPNKKANTNGPKNLLDVANGKWQHLVPTPTVSGNNNSPKSGTKRGTGLATFAKLWPTPKATDFKGSVSPERAKQRQQESSRGVDLSEEITRRNFLWPTPNAVQGNCDGRLGEWGGQGNWVRKYPALANGKLNPTWVEWLMGWPLGWTDLEPLETDRSHSVPPRHSPDCGTDGGSG